MARIAYFPRRTGETDMSIFSNMRPIVSALHAHRAATLLMVLSTALTLAVLCNLIFIVAGTFNNAKTPTGVDEANIGVVQFMVVPGSEQASTTAENITRMASVPGVASVAFGGVPLWYSDRTALFAQIGDKQPLAKPGIFFGSQGYSKTLGVQVLQGRDLRDDEIPTDNQLWSEDGPQPPPPMWPILLTEPLAKRLFPDKPALGQVLYSKLYGSQLTSLQVVGVIAPLRASITGHAGDAEAILAEFKFTDSSNGGGYVIRSQPGQLQRVLPLAVQAAQQNGAGWVTGDISTLPELRANRFAGDYSRARMFITIIGILLFVTALGITGLASFWVQQRTKQIGIRRALGATRGDILHYFQLENFLIVGGGVLLGALLAFALNQWLMHRFELDRLTVLPVIVGVLAMWLLGQIAVLGPARRAAAVPPIVATRGG
jgi:putative ABC transport system permease protein